MNILLIVGIIVLLFGIILFIVSLFQNKKYGVLTKERIYQDTDLSPGKVLYAKSINLIGKPDYLLKENNQIIPVEVKTGKTPVNPYQNHIMQLTAYCLLVEELYEIRPKYGYIKYPQQEFSVQYTEENKNKLIELITRITQAKIENIEFSCNHPYHNEELFNT